MAYAPSSNLPDTHDLVVFLRDAYGMDLNVPRIAVVPKLKDVP
jgi:hypothetical protein